MKSHYTASFEGQCHEIVDHFFGLKDSTWAPNEKRISMQSLTLHTAVLTFLNYCYLKCKHTQIHFLPDCFQKCPGRLGRVRVVVDPCSDYGDTVSAQSMTMLTSCLHNNDYADIMSVQSMLISACVRAVNDYFSTCPRSQQLRGHAIFADIILYYYILL